MKRKIVFLLACLVASALFFTACESGNQGQEGKEAAAPKKIKLVYVEWSDAVASTNVMKVLLEDLGYKVETLPVSAAAMWQSVATGNADAMVAAWLPTTHKHYYEKVKDQVENLGPNVEGTRIGLVVPEYVTISSIPELAKNADKFDEKIIGIDPGAGIMSSTEKALEEYNLDMELVEGSGATMTSALKGAIKNKEWIVVTGWNPHWKFIRWDLKYLKDPKKVYGEAGHVDTVVRQGLKKDMPEAYQLLDNFQWDIKDLEKVLMWNQEKKADPYKNAKKWVKQNPEKVKQWMP
ncbi:MAG: glycine betaine ABC transporter substrate-binding protein [bacterium]